MPGFEDSELLAWLPGDRQLADAVGASVLARYDEVHRRYHDGRHVRAVAARCVDLADAVGLGDRAPVIWAALWHDAIYDPHSGTNEADSAGLAERDLRSLGVGSALVAEVSRLIMLTAGHAVADDDLAGAVLVDADLAVLGASPADYADYRAGVRFEYSFVDEESWRVGRARVLASLLELPALFRTPSMVERNEAARRNLSMELRALIDEAS